MRVKQSGSSRLYVIEIEEIDLLRIYRPELNFGEVSTNESKKIYRKHGWHMR